MITFDRIIKPQSLENFKQRTALRNENDQKNVAILNAWNRALKKDLRLVHTISARGGLSSHGNEDWKNSPFCKDKKSIESLFSTWDVISTSCVGLSDQGIVGGTALEIILVLDVPYQNILGTHLRDVWFDNFAGLERGKPGGKVIDKAALSRNILNGTAKFNGSKGFKMDKPYNTLLHPNIFRKSNAHSKHYNEVLLIGRPGLILHPTVPPTGKIKVSEIVFNPSYFQIKSKAAMLRQTQQKLLVDLKFLTHVMVYNGIRYVYLPFTFDDRLHKLKINEVLKSLFLTHVSGAKYKLA